MTADIFPYLWFSGFVVLLLFIDLFVVHRKAHEVSLKEAVGWSLFWISVAMLFNIYIYYARGIDDAMSFFTGYLIELSLSVDNLFVFLLIFKYFHTPRIALHRVLFWGILGAILMRALFIWLGIILISQFHWMIYVFGAFLVVTGIKFALEKDKEIHPERNPLLILFQRFFPTTLTYEGVKFFVKTNGHYIATPLFTVLLAIETSDIIFAIDSIPAILAITFDPYLVFTSNIFAVLGLRSLFFVLEKLMTAFHHLHYGLSVILIFIGVKMLVSGIFPIPTFLALMVVFLVLLFSILASVLYPSIGEKSDEE